jgi:hypothetical protein
LPRRLWDFRAPTRLLQLWLWLELTSPGACDLVDHDLPARHTRARILISFIPTGLA